jgi:organic radical activating enzyme
VSINLDLTTACNYACDHCIDMDILNTGIMFDHDKLLSSLALMAEKGLKSVIVIGGGEPTLYPKFGETMRFMKSLGLQVSIVSNGAGNRRIAEVADCFDENDWVRLSLDSGTDETFQLMHKPKKAITLDSICEVVPDIKARNPRLTVGFSYIVTWCGAETNDTAIVENLGEIALAARRARDHQFSYIAFKPFLTRAESNNAEVIGIDKGEGALAGVVGRIREQVEEAKTLATKDFRVIETTGLKALYTSGAMREYARQPRECHMQFFRQVLSPLGTYNCPVYRNQPHGQLGDKNAYADADAFTATRRRTAESLATFDASTTCAEVTCLYNDVNWWIEDLIENPEKMKSLGAICGDEPDFFL